jgi:hypothetical protein
MFEHRFFCALSLLYLTTQPLQELPILLVNDYP